MSDKEPGKKHLVNLDGIRFHITGDPTSEEARRRIHAARLDVEQLNVTHPVPISRLERPGKYEIRTTHGRHEVTMTIPEVPVEKVEKKKVRKVKEEGYTFVPAIMIGTEEEIMDFAYNPAFYDGFQGESDYSVCNTRNWEGVRFIIEDVPTPQEFAWIPGHTFCLPGEEGKWRDINPLVAVKSLTDWGNRGFYGDFDWDDSYEESGDDGSFSPGPAIPQELPYYQYGVAHAVALNRLADILSPVYAGLAMDHDIWDEYYAAYEDCRDETVPLWRCWRWFHMDAYDFDFCCSHGGGDCYYRHWSNTAYIAWTDQCVGGYFWFHYIVYKWRLLIYTPNMWAFMGFCYAGDGWIYEEKIEGEELWNEEIGGPQTRDGWNKSSSKYWGVAYPWWPDEWRSGGDITWEHDEYGNYDHDTQHLELPTMCLRTQRSTQEYHDIYTFGMGDYGGAYIQDIGSEANICPNENFKNLYFVLTAEYHYYFDYDRTTPYWHAENYGYVDGVWQDGTISNVTGQVPDDEISRLEDFFVLVVILNGERIEIDRTDDYGGRKTMRTNDEYYGLDSHIFDFNGTPVYMYSYVRVRRNDDGDTIAQYTQYGYFLNGEHFRSKKFEPVGITDSANDLFGLHDVAGSSEKETPKYGFGQCAGFIVKHTFEREVPV